MKINRSPVVLKINLKGELELNGLSKKTFLKNNISGNFNSKTDLTFFENLALPRNLPNTNTIELNDNQINLIINDVLSCSICLQIYNQPVNIKTCLHKFCRSCIETYMRTCKRECGICRTPIETRRLLRDDYKIGNIISSMISEIKIYNQVQQKQFNEILFKTCQKQITVKKVENFDILEKYNELITLIFVSGKKQFACHSMPQTTLREFARFLCQRENIHCFKTENRINFFIQEKDNKEIDLNHSITIDVLNYKFGYYNKGLIIIHFRFV